MWSFSIGRDKMRKVVLLLTVFMVMLAMAGCPNNAFYDTSEKDTEQFGTENTTSANDINNTGEDETSEELDFSSGESQTSQEEPEEGSSFADEEELSFEYELDTNRNYYFLTSGYDRETETGVINPTLTQEGDHYLLSGIKRYSGTIILTWKQKALLDFGAIMNVTYEGELVEQITAEAGVDLERVGEGKYISVPCVWYKGVERERDISFFVEVHDRALSPDFDERAREEAGIELSEPPYGGVGFPLYASDLGIAFSENAFVILDENAQIILSGDTPMQVIREEELVWITVGEYYEKWISKLDGVIKFPVYFMIYEENGEVVKVLEKNTETFFRDEYFK